MTVDVVIPTYNEEHTLEAAVRALVDHLAGVPFAATVTIADNASTDQTQEVAARLSHELSGVRVVHVPTKGRGGALRTAWSTSTAEVLVYMDVDLSTNLNALLPLVAPLLSGHSDLAVGNRLDPSARVLRGSKRELISRSYNLLLRGTLGAGFGDAQCGFKAIRADTAQWLLPLVQDDGWFFDTELLVLAERAGLRVYQVPVDWVDDPDSRVDLWRTALEDLKGIRRLGWSLARQRVPLVSQAQWPTQSAATVLNQLTRFLGIGVLSTIAFALGFLLLRTQTTAATADVLALVATTVLNTAANRRWTFGRRGRLRAVTHQIQGLLVMCGGVLVTTTALAVAADAGVRGSWGELSVLTGANLLVTVGRFAAFRWWIFRSLTPYGGLPPRGAPARVDLPGRTPDRSPLPAAVDQLGLAGRSPVELTPAPFAQDQA